MEPDDSTGIAMVSAPTSPPDELLNDTADDQEIFHTPLPRYRSTSNSPAFYDCNEDAMIVGGLNLDGKADDAGSIRVIDLGKEEGVDSAKKIESDWNQDGTFHMESEGTMVIESHAEPLATGSKEEITEAETNSIECDTEIGMVECENDNGEVSSESDTNIVEDIDSAGTGSNSCETEEKLKKNGVLPSLADEHSGPNSGGRTEDYKEITLLDVLQMLANVDPGEDKKQAHLTLLEVAEARWGPF